MLDQTPGPDTLVPIEDVAKQFTVSVPTIRAWLRQGYIPKDCYLHIGNTYRFHVNKLMDRLLNAPESTEPDTPAQVQLELPFEPPVDASSGATSETDRDL